MSAKLTLQLVTRNGSRYLPYLLRSLEKQTFRDWTILALDNGSTPEEAAANRQAVESSSLPIELLFSETNLGFAGGHNRLFAENDSEYVLLLNDDTLLEPEYLERLVEQLDSVPDCAAAAGRIYRWDFDRRDGTDGGRTDTIDTIGLREKAGGNVQDLGAGHPASRLRLPAGPQPVFGVSGCLPMYRTTAVRACHPDGQLFDQSYGSYKEDTDLAYRLRAGGFTAHTVHRAVAYHRRTIGQGVRRPISDEVRYLSYRNHHWMMLTNFGEFPEQVAYRPDIAVREILKALYWAIRKPEFVRNCRKDTAEQREWMERKRRFVDSLRRHRPADGLTPAEVEVAVIMVSTNDLNVTCLESLKRAAESSSSRIRLVVADNVSTAYRANELVEGAWPGSYCLLRDGNHGYGRSCNRAAREIEADFYLILNPDTVLSDPTAIDRMVDYLKDHPSVGMVGPKIVNDAGETQDTCRRFPTWYQPLVIRSGLRNTAWGKRYANRFLMRDYDHRTVRPVEWVQGSAMLLPRAVWKGIGGFDDRFWLYFEDVDLCRRTWLAGREIHYLPEAVIRHAHGRESAKFRNPLVGIIRNRPTRGHIISWIRYFLKWAGHRTPRLD